MARYRSRHDADALSQLVSCFLGPALTVARGRLGDRGLAEDAVQEAFLHIVRSSSSYRPGMPFASWFYAVLRNACTDILRRRARQANLIQNAAHTLETSVDPPAAHAMDAVHLLAQLPESGRTVLTLRILHEMPFREVATALGVTEEAAKKRAQRALRDLRHLAEASERRSAPPASSRPTRPPSTQFAREPVPGRTR